MTLNECENNKEELYALTKKMVNFPDNLTSLELNRLLDLVISRCSPKAIQYENGFWKGEVNALRRAFAQLVLVLSPSLSKADRLSVLSLLSDDGNPMDKTGESMGKIEE